MKYWLRFIIWGLEYDLACERERLEHIRECITHDEATLHQWKLRLMGVGR